MIKYKKKDPFLKKDDPKNYYTEIIPIDEIEGEKKTKNKIPEAVFTTASIIGIIAIAICIIYPLVLLIHMIDGISLA